MVVIAPPVVAWIMIVSSPAVAQPPVATETPTEAPTAADATVIPTETPDAPATHAAASAATLAAVVATVTAQAEALQTVESARASAVAAFRVALDEWRKCSAKLERCAWAVNARIYVPLTVHRW